MTDEVVSDDIHSVFQGGEELVETVQTAVSDRSHPPAERSAAGFLGVFFVKEAWQFFAQGIRLAQQGGSLKQPIEEGLLFGLEVLAPLSQGPQHPFQSGVLFFREG